MEDTTVAHPGVTSRQLSGAVERAAYTISEFCNAHRISRAHYYNLKKLGQGPDEARAGDRTVIITLEAAARWRRQGSSRLGRNGQTDCPSRRNAASDEIHR
jgi:hypothetical protein